MDWTVEIKSWIGRDWLRFMHNPKTDERVMSIGVWFRVYFLVEGVPERMNDINKLF